MMTKKNILWASALIGGIMLVLNDVGTKKICSWFGGDTICMGQWYDFIIVFLPIFPLFLFSLITYWMREEIYTAWFRFVRWFIPLSMMLIFITPSDTGGGFGPQLSLGKSDIALLTSLFFVVISIVQIGITSWALRKRG